MLTTFPRHLAIGALCLGAAACADPTGSPSRSARFEALLQEPALAVSQARDSAFAEQFRSWSGLGRAGLRTIRDNGAWLALWDSVTAFVAPQPPAPTVDFDTEMVVLAAHGTAPTTGYSIDITHVTAVRDTVFVLAERTRPGNDCFTGQALTAPLDARVVPRSQLPTVLLTEQYVFDCNTQRRRLEQ